MDNLYPHGDLTYVSEVPLDVGSYAQELAGDAGLALVRLFREVARPMDSGFRFLKPGLVARDPQSIGLEGYASFMTDDYRHEDFSSRHRLAHLVSLGLAAGGTPQVYLSCRTTALDGHSLAKASDASPFDVFVFAEAGDRPSLRALQGPAVVPDTALAVWVDAVVARSSGLRPPTTDAASG